MQSRVSLHVVVVGIMSAGVLCPCSVFILSCTLGMGAAMPACALVCCRCTLVAASHQERRRCPMTTPLRLFLILSD